MGAELGGTSPQSVYQLNPLQDARWRTFLELHPRASVFHTPGWLQALQRTYGYRPVVYTTSAPAQTLSNGIVFCQVNSWITGRRMVSVPFADHCQPLVNRPADLRVILESLKRNLLRQSWKYLEFRPLHSLDTEPELDSHFGKSASYSFHSVDLQQDLNTLFHNFHKSCVQRKIRRAEREGLQYEEGRSQSLLEKFYRLLLLTRRRHQFPPQPMAWFQNLADCLGDRLSIRVISRGEQPIAGIVTLSFKDSLVYKYGCSDEKFHNLGAMPLLFWIIIQEGKRLGARGFDLGRSELSNVGLITFKEHLGAARSELAYYRYPASQFGSSHSDWQILAVQNASAHLPTPLFRTLGRLLYRHIG